MAALSLCHLVPLCTAALVSWLCFGGEAYSAALFFCLRTRVLRSCELRHIPRVLTWTCVSIVARFCACLGYFIAFVPFLLCGSDTVSFALCLAMCFYDHRGLLRASAATAMPFCRRRYKHRRLSICGMHCCIYMRYIVGWSPCCFCGGFWLVLRVLCELLRERLRFGDFPCFSPITSQNYPPTSFRRFRYCPGHAALRSDGRRSRRRRREFASAAASSLHCFIAE